LLIVGMNRLACIPLLLAACVADPDDGVDCAEGRCDQTCDLPAYGDGVCDPMLPCDVPDIDCFRTFSDADEAAAWFAELEPRAAMVEGRSARGIVPLDDPRYAPVRELLDRGWEAMRTNRPVGQLADARPALLIVDDPSVNAFVFPEDVDQKRASFAVMVHSGLLEIPTTDDANLGLIMHELQHAVGLHVVAAVKAQYETYYLAEDGFEPIGNTQTDDPAVRELASRWRGHAGEIGSFVDPNMRGLPTGGQLQAVFRQVLQGAQQNPAGCANARALLTEVSTDLVARLDPISGAPALEAAFGDRVDAAFDALRDECVPDAPSFTETVAALAGVTPDEIDAQLTAEDRALVTGRHVVDAIAALAENRRAKMRAIEDSAYDMLGAPWTAVRYYSEEENADDVSVPVLRASGFDPAGLGTFLNEVLSTPAATAACNAVLDAGEIPHYGVDLEDTHHGNCWRVYHIDQLAASGSKPRARRTMSPLVEVPRLPIPRPRKIAVY
jgi:hypothetical protein